MKKTLQKLLLPALVSMSAPVFAISVGEQLPTVNVEELGECIVADGDIEHAPWSSAALRGGLQVIEHAAARAGVESLNSAFYSALETSGVDGRAYGITKIVNSDDALWGTSGLVAGEVGKNKIADPNVAFVIDAEGLAQRQWELEKKTSALILLDADGKVIYFKQGGTSAEDAAEAVAALQAQAGAE